MKKRWIYVLVGLVVIVAAFSFSRLGPKTIPPALHGRWVTDAPQYDKCYIYLAPGFVQIGNQEGDSHVGVVMGIHLETGLLYPRYDIAYYDTLGEKSVLTLFYSAGDGTLRLGNQATIRWRLQGGDEDPELDATIGLESPKHLRLPDAGSANRTTAMANRGT